MVPPELEQEVVPEKVPAPYLICPPEVPELLKLIVFIGSNDNKIYGEAIIPIENFINEDISKGSYTTNPIFEKEERQISDSISLYNKTPLAPAFTNISDSRKYIKAEGDTERQLSRNIPHYGASTNISDMKGIDNSDKNYKLHPKINPGQFEGKGTRPKEGREEYEYISLGDQDNIRKKAYSAFSDRYSLPIKN